MSGGQLKRWEHFYKVLSDPDCSAKLKRYLIDLAPKQVVEELEELCLNIHQNESIALQSKTLSLLKKFKKVGLGLASATKSIPRKKNLLKTKQGLLFLEKLLPVLLFEVQQTGLEKNGKGEGNESS